MTSGLLQVKGLSLSFSMEPAASKAVDQLDFTLEKGEILGIVGESGCGKSLTSLAIMGLLPPALARIEGGVTFNGANLLTLREKELRRIRGNEISMIFQEPMTSLNPVYTIGNQLIETLKLHRKLNRKQAYEHAIELLKLVRIPEPEKIYKQYPYELSGGLRQRVMIAIALSCDPKILIADEPTTALDVTIQSEILELLRELRSKLSMSVILISHDLGVISEIADRVMVIYAGTAVEYARVERIFDHPRHPYTQGLLNSIPSLYDKKDRLETIEGKVPGADDMPRGCKFHPRCKHRTSLCETFEPALYPVEEGQARCWMYSKEWTSNVGK